jgi:hypothetical protein
MFKPNQTPFQACLTRIEKATKKIGFDPDKRIVTSRDEAAQSLRKALRTQNVCPCGGRACYFLKAFCILPSVLNSFLEVPMDTNIPADLLNLKARFDEWYKTRKNIRSRIPDDLRLALAEMLCRYPPALICSLCRISRSSLNRIVASKKSPKKPKPKEPFFILPPPTLPEPHPATSHLNGGCRIQLERADGSRLTVILPLLDSSTLTSLCGDFLTPENR